MQLVLENKNRLKIQCFSLEQIEKNDLNYNLKLWYGEVAEWLKATASKAVIPGNWNRGFESDPLHQSSLIQAFGLGKLRLGVRLKSMNKTIIISLIGNW